MNTIGPRDDMLGAEAMRRMAAIREVLRNFDWDSGDRQLALEEIDRIAFGGAS